MGTTARSSSIIRGSSRVHGRRTCRQRALLSVSSPADSLPRRSPRPLGVPWHVQPPSRARVSSRLRAILWTWTLALAQLCFFFWRLWLDWRRTQGPGGRASLRALRCGSGTDWPPSTALANEPCAKSAQLFSARRTCLLAPLKGWLAPPSVAGVHAEVPRVVFVAAADDCVLLA